MPRNGWQIFKETTITLRGMVIPSCRVGGSSIYELRMKRDRWYYRASTAKRKETESWTESRDDVEKMDGSTEGMYLRGGW